MEIMEAPPNGMRNGRLSRSGATVEIESTRLVNGVYPVRDKFEGRDASTSETGLGWSHAGLTNMGKIHELYAHA
jgi:hypothetical protein